MSQADKMLAGGVDAVGVSGGAPAVSGATYVNTKTAGGAVAPCVNQSAGCDARNEQPHPASSGSVNPLAALADIALTQVGVHEVGSTNSGERVRQYQATTALGGTGWPWCAAFVCWAVRQLIALRPGLLSCETKPPSAADVMGLLHWASATGQLVFEPLDGIHAVQAGDIICWGWKSGHHTAIITGPAHEAAPSSGFLVPTVEGNTSGPIKASRDERNGGEVAAKKRTFAGCVGIIRLSIKAKKAGGAHA